MQIESLCTMLGAARKWFDVYLAIPPRDHVRLPLSISTQLAQSIVVLYRLTIFECSGWDRKLVRETCSLSCILEQVVKKFQRVPVEAGLVYDDESLHFKLFSVNIRKLTSIKDWWQAKESALQQATDLESSQIPAVGDNVPTVHFGDAWLNEMLMGEFQSDPLQTMFGAETGAETSEAAFGWQPEIQGNSER